jgi:Na+-driven multidrug efflux pump
VSTLSANALAALVLGRAHLLRRDGAVQLRRAAWRLAHGRCCATSFACGIPASVNPVISNTSIAVATAFVSHYGVAALAGYGVAARLEYILVPIAFGFGTALTTMVAHQHGRRPGGARAARHVMGAAVVTAITGSSAWLRRSTLAL